MGRIFETRKATMFARWDRMAKAFTRVGKDIAIAVKAAGPNPDSNPALRRAIQNARAVNMPKDKVESAIKRAPGRTAASTMRPLEGYAPNASPSLVRRPTTTTARSPTSAPFSRFGGNLGATGASPSSSRAWASSARPGA